jgi:hypothetical protein
MKSSVILYCHRMQDNFFSLTLPNIRGTRWHSWLRHCATSRKVTFSIPDGVNGIFHWHNPSGHTMALWLTQPLTEMCTRNISLGGKGGRWVRLTSPPSRADCLEIWESQPSIHACNGTALPLANIKPITRRNAHFSWPNYIVRNTYSLNYISTLVSNGLDVPSVFCKYRWIILWSESQESIVRVATRPQAGCSKIWIPAEKKNNSLLQDVEIAQRPKQPSTQWSLSWEKSDRHLTLTTDLYPALRLRMTGAIPLLTLYAFMELTEILPS